MTVFLFNSTDATPATTRIIMKAKISFLLFFSNPHRMQVTMQAITTLIVRICTQYIYTIVTANAIAVTAFGFSIRFKNK